VEKSNAATFISPVDLRTRSDEFTGLTDQRGKEIYERDIVRWQGWKNKPLAGGRIGQVVWSPEGKWIIKENHVDAALGVYPNIEVIGTSDENPELLTS
jgi:uncharacterized phage protein (TIGR01671 family)